MDVDELYRQQKDINAWHIESAVTDIYSSIARKSKSEFENALRLFFSGKVSFPLRAFVLNVVMNENIMSADELLSLMNEFDFKGKPYWESVLITMLPEGQVNDVFLKLLINTFLKPDEYIYIHRMLDYLKYEAIFEEYKKENPELENHNIITYLTSIILTKTRKTRRDFGFDFCADCSSYFTKHPQLLKEAYWAQYEIDAHFDYEAEN